MLDDGLFLRNALGTASEVTVLQTKKLTCKAKDRLLLSDQRRV